MTGCPRRRPGKGARHRTRAPPAGGASPSTPTRRAPSPGGGRAARTCRDARAGRGRRAGLGASRTGAAGSLSAKPFGKGKRLRSPKSGGCAGRPGAPRAPPAAGARRWRTKTRFSRVQKRILFSCWKIVLKALSQVAAEKPPGGRCWGGASRDGDNRAGTAGDGRRRGAWPSPALRRALLRDASGTGARGGGAAVPSGHSRGRGSRSPPGVGWEAPRRAPGSAGS